MAITASDFMKIMSSRMLFNEEDKKILQENADFGKEIAPEMAQHFYDYLQNDAEMNGIINSEAGRIHRLHQTFIEWFQEMFTGIDNWGDNYAQRRWKIGLAHVRVGIEPRHVVPAMAKVMTEVTQKLKETEQQALRESLSKVCMIDLAFIEQTYIETSAKAVLQETGWSEVLFKRLITNAVK